MTVAFLDVCKFLPASGGTGDWVYDSVVQGYQDPTAADAADGKIYRYRAESADLLEWEVGLGEYDAGTDTFARTEVIANSLGTTAKINFTVPPVVGITFLAKDLIRGHGQCVLMLVGANLVLQPKNGHLLIINGRSEEVPAGGVSLPPTGLTASTKYYIYALMSSGVMILEAVTTAYAVSTAAENRDVVIKSGDNTRTLVGMVYPIAGPAFVDSWSQRFVRTWFNDPGVRTQVRMNNTSGVRYSTSNTGPAFAEVTSTIRNYALFWAGEDWDISLAGAALAPSQGPAIWCGLGVDSTTVSEPIGSYFNGGGGGYASSISAPNIKTGLSEDVHYVTLLALVSSGTYQFAGGSLDNTATAVAARTVGKAAGSGGAVRGDNGAAGAAGPTNLPQNSQGGNYTTVLADAGKHIYHSALATHTYTIDAAVSYAIGDTISFVNSNGGGGLNIALSSGTLVLAGSTTTGTRALAVNGIATALKVEAARWLISGPGLT